MTQFLVLIGPNMLLVLHLSLFAAMHPADHIKYTLLCSTFDNGILSEAFQKDSFSVMGCGTSAPTQTEVPEEGGVGKESP